MKDALLLHKKKKFITWFLETHSLKRPDTAKILGCLLDNERLLSGVHFVEDIRCLPNAVIISAEDSSTVSFLCRINNEYHENVDEIIAHLEMAPPAELFVWLSFDREFMCSLCANVLEGRPEVGRHLVYYRVVRELEKELNLAFQARDKHKIKLLQQIDDTLERGDRERFLVLSSLYKELYGY